MQTQIKMWGNSASVRIPAQVMLAARLSTDQTVDVREQDGRIVIEPVVQLRYDLDVMVDGIQDDQLHDLEDWGAPVGPEIW